MNLPNVFKHMPGGRVWGILFFIFMSFAALSPVIAVFENIISLSIDMFGWKRKKSLIINLIGISAVSYTHLCSSLLSRPATRSEPSMLFPEMKSPAFANTSVSVLDVHKRQPWGCKPYTCYPSGRGW